MNGLRVIVDKSCIFHKDYFTVYNRDWNSNTKTNLGVAYDKCSMNLLLDTVDEIGILEISNKESKDYKRLLFLS